MVIAILLIIVSFFFPPLFVISIPYMLYRMVKSGIGSFGRGMKDMKVAQENWREVKTKWNAVKERKANSKVHAHNRTEKDNENLARLRAEIAKDRELKKNRKGGILQ